MKTFHFKLESVLLLRERAEAQARQSHAESGRRLEDATRQLHESEAKCKALAGQINAVQRASFRPAEREMLWNALRHQQGQSAKLTQTVDLAARDLEEKRALLLRARRDHEAMLKLMDKEHRNHARMAEKEERSMIDDLINARHTITRGLIRAGGRL